MADPYALPTAEDLQAGMAGAPRAQAPGPDFLDSIALGFKRGFVRADWGLNQASHEGALRSRILGAMAKRGRGIGMAGMDPRFGGQANGDDDMFTTLAQLRAEDPEFLSDFSDVVDRKSFSARVARERAEEEARLNAQLQGGSGTGAFVGEIGRSFLDPLSWIPVGGSTAKTAGIARQILTTAGREAVANVAVTVATEPLVQQDAARLHQERGFSDFAFDVGLSAVAGAGIGGGVSAVGHAGGKVVDALTPLDRQIAGAIKSAEIDPGAHYDVARDRAARAFREAVPEENWTPTERAAVHVAERDAQVRQTSPYEATPDGDDAHAEKLEGWLDAIVNDAPSPTPAPSVPRETVTRSQVASGAAPNVRAPAREQLKARIRQAESSGDDRAVPRDPKTGELLSSASGRYQFTIGTWLRYYKRRYGKGESNDVIWAKRFDGNLQEVLMNDLVGDNAAALRKAGQPETAGSLYLLHFAGEDGGLKILRAAPDTPIERILSAEAVAKNKLHGKTAGDMVAWADRKMGEAPGATHGEPGGGPDGERAARAEEPIPDMPEPVRLDMDFEPRKDWLEGADRPFLRADLFGTSEEHARAQIALWEEQDAAEGFARVVDDPPPPGPIVEVKDRRPAQDGGRQRSGPVHVLQAIADAGGIIDNEGHSLVEAMGVPRFRKDAGTIIRPEGHPRGRSIDGIGEYLWDQGYFGPPETTPRPSVDEVLELIERGIREKVYKPDEAADVRARGHAPEEDDVRWELGEAAREHGLELDTRTLDDALARRAQGVPAEDAVREAAEAAAFRDLDAAADLTRFDEPDGDGATLQIDSIEHDLRMMLESDGDRAFILGEEGDAVSLAEMFGELDDDINAVAEMRACMAPAREAAE